MRRNWRIRLFGLLFAPWFAAVVGGAATLHVCPAHGSHAAAHSVRLTHAASHSANTPHSVPSPHDQSQHQCTCLGCCCAASGAALPVASAATLPRTVAFRHEAVPFFRSAVVARVERILPFATAPPVEVV